MGEGDSSATSFIQTTLAAIRALNTLRRGRRKCEKWDGGRLLSGEVSEGLPSFGGFGVLPPGKFLENIAANLCNLVHFGNVR